MAFKGNSKIRMGVAMGVPKQGSTPSLPERHRERTWSDMQNRWLEPSVKKHTPVSLDKPTDSPDTGSW